MRRTHRRPKRLSRGNSRPWPLLFFFPLSIFFLECVVKVHCFHTLIDRGLGYAFLFSLPAGLLCALLSSLLGARGNRRVSLLLMGLLTVWYMAQTVYYTIFRTFLVLDTLGMAGEALSNYWREALGGIGDAIVPLLLLAVPMALLCLLGRRLVPAQRVRPPVLAAVAGGMAALHLAAVLVVNSATSGIMSPRVLYQYTFMPTLSVSNFGVATTLRLDAKQMLFGLREDDPVRPSPTPDPAQDPDPTPSVPVYGSNVMDIDFDTLIANESDNTLLDMHSFFRDRTPTMQNEYTGLFKGKNLIFLTGEGFWKYAVDKTLTPTLYRLANEGFVFTNFYNPLWWKSTIDGEYVACTGLIPTGAYRSFKASGSNSMPFCMGNQFRALGYPTKAYHNHTYTYYNRDISHPNMGYDYFGLGNGLEVRKTWPESDLEMMELTIPDALAGALPFHNYYMTVSGHMNYNFLGNAMSYKHREAAKAAYPEHSEEFQAYLACNMELDLALAYLLDQLEAAGELENTVICMSGDHYPYAMDPATWNEFAGHEVDTTSEVYESTLILWAGDMEEPVVVDKPCESLDIIATLSNLFGLEYDSRLIAGRDILADEPGLVVFSNRSFITDLGRYDAASDTFTPNEGAEVPEGYVTRIFQEVQDMFRYSVKILENDYYAKIGLTVPG